MTQRTQQGREVLRRPVRSHPTAALALSLIAGAACSPSPYREAQVSLEAPGTTAAAAKPSAARKFRFSVAAMESPRGTYSAYSRLFERLRDGLGVDVDLVQRRTYREVNDLLAAGQLDAALVCTGGYLDLERRSPGAVEVLAVPVVQGRSTYESVVIVPAASEVRDVSELAGKRFAYTDELSFSGRTYFVRLLEQRGHAPERFFSNVIFTHSHDRSIQAVARGIVDGAAVHGIIYDHLVHQDPLLATQTRMIHRSPPFGMMPVVASTRLAPAQRARLREVLVGLGSDPAGAEALRALGIERFVPPARALFDSAAALAEAKR